MTRIQKTVLWTVAAVVFCVLGARFLIVKVPMTAEAQTVQVGPPAGSDGTAIRENQEATAQTPQVNQPGVSAAGPASPLRATEPAVAGDTVVNPFKTIRSHQKRIDAAVRKLQAAQSDDEKQAAKDALRKVLSQVFAADMQAREKQAQAIELRLAKLRQQYQAREKVKDEIIDLQLQVLEQDAAGLGFPAARPTASPPEYSSGYPAEIHDRHLPAVAPNFYKDSSLPDGPFDANVPAARADQHDPTPWDFNLAEAKQTHSAAVAAVAELRKRGHFIESLDDQLYAYATTKQPSGPSVVRVVDVATGKLVATATIDSVVGPLEFTDDGWMEGVGQFMRGVASREANGTLQLRIPLGIGPDGNVYDAREAAPLRPARTAVPRYTTEDAPPHLGTSVLQPARTAGPASRPAPVVAEYNELRGQYLTRLAEMRIVEARFAELVAEAQKQEPDTSADEVKKRHPQAWQLVEQARAALDEANRLFEAQLKLRWLDLETAKVAAAAAKTRLDDLTALYEKNAVTRSEVTEQQAAVQTAELQVQRAQTLYELFESIKDAPPTDTGSEPGDNDGAGSEPTPLQTVREEARRMLQGTWNCVAASAQEVEYESEEVSAWELEFQIQDDRVTVSYIGDDLKPHQTAGTLLIDPNASPPQFHIDVNVAGLQGGSRLSGQATLDRGVLRLTQPPGGAFLIGRQLDPEPSIFDFQRRPSATSADSGGDAASAG